MNNLDIRELRQKLGLTQLEFAKKIGVSENTIQNWERGRKIPASKDEILRSFALKTQNYAGGGEQTNVNGNNIDGNTVNVNPAESVEKLMELLTAKEASLAKAQEHIDKLLGIIENITKGNNND